MTGSEFEMAETYARIHTSDSLGAGHEYAAWYVQFAAGERHVVAHDVWERQTS